MKAILHKTYRTLLRLKRFFLSAKPSHVVMVVTIQIFTPTDHDLWQYSQQRRERPIQLSSHFKAFLRNSRGSRCKNLNFL